MNPIMKLTRGSGNVFRDLGRHDADAEQRKAILAAQIIKTLDREHLTAPAAHARTDIAAADLTRIRNADLSLFTIRRLMSILKRMRAHAGVDVRVQTT